jgi:hypothetical protein
MLEIKAPQEKRAKYRFAGRTGDHMHTAPHPDEGRAKNGETVRGWLEPGEEVELTDDQYQAFKDRFIPLHEAKRRETGLDADKFPRGFNRETVPIKQDLTGGNLIQETDVIVDRHAGPDAFKSAGQITADHAKQFKEARENADEDTPDAAIEGEIGGAARNETLRHAAHTGATQGDGARAATGQGKQSATNVQSTGKK